MYIEFSTPVVTYTMNLRESNKGEKYPYLEKRLPYAVFLCCVSIVQLWVKQIEIIRNFISDLQYCILRSSYHSDESLLLRTLRRNACQRSGEGFVGIFATNSALAKQNHGKFRSF